ncbi:MAG: CHAT domain-containing protein [Caldilineaceae bacterium]
MKHSDYLNFDLLIYRSDNGYTARVTNSPIESKGSVEFVLSTDDIPSIEESADTLQVYGATLFDRVFAGDVGKSLLLNFQDARRQQRGLRIRLNLDKGVPELAVIPWELLYSSDWNRFVTYSSLTPLVRYIEGLQDATTLKTEEPLRILVVISNPQDQQTLDALAEWNRLNDALAALLAEGSVQLEKLENPTRSALQKRLLKDDVHILHYIGHGYFEKNANNQDEGGLLMESLQQTSDKFNATELAILLHDRTALRLVFLNTCEGATSGYADYFAGTAQKLIQQGIPAVVAMQFPVTDSAAICLSEFFYQTLATGLPLDSALSEARKAVALQTDTGLAMEWATPALFSRSPDNQLFVLPTVVAQSQDLPFALHELFDLIGQALIDDQALLALYQQSLPPLTKARASANLHSILFDLWNLAESATVGSPLVNFAQAVSTNTTKDKVRAELGQWIKRQQPSGPIASLPVAPPLPQGLYEPCLQIELRPDPQSPPGATKQFLVRMVLWQQGQEQSWYDEQQALSLDKIPAVLLRVMADNNHRLPAEAAFEFIAPRELFNEKLDEWETSEEYGLICGENYPVVLRSLDRLSSPPAIRAKLLEKWQDKWESFQIILEDFAAGKFEWYAPDPDFKKLGSDLDKKVLTGCMGLNAAPNAPDIFKALIIAGIPVALWPRMGALTMETLESLTTKHLAMKKLVELPKWLQHVRAHAAELNAPFVLLWDDPTRIPKRYRDEGVAT